jgi:hypothetical protein
MGIVTSQPAAARTRTALFPVREREERRDRIAILDNPLAAENPGLARALEQEIRRLLKDEGVGAVEVRFRVCRDEADGFTFVCKVENPPCDGEDGQVQWRWWSPLLETAEGFRDAFEEGLRIRRERLSGRRGPHTV